MLPYLKHPLVNHLQIPECRLWKLGHSGMSPCLVEVPLPELGATVGPCLLFLATMYNYTLIQLKAL